MRKLTHKQFLENLWNGSKYYREGGFEVIGQYVNNRTKMLIKDKYGILRVPTSNLQNGATPSIQSAIDKTSYCINQFREVHGNKYNYDKVDYKNSTTKVTIGCPKHGEFKQDPHCHLLGQGCYECVRYSRLDGRRLTTEKFIEKSKVIHDDRYDYSKVNVRGNKNKVVIICKEHGEFKQSPNAHLRGDGCRDCYLEHNGYNRSKFVYFAKGNECIIYLLECYNEDERFLKIGITSKSVEVRFNGDRKLPYNYKVIKELKSSDSACIWDEEVLLKRRFKQYKYTPKIKFKGYTECFNIQGREDIINYLKEKESEFCSD